jgi:hypothetical protein
VTWRVAASLETLRKQLNAIAPKRSIIADGSIGDAAHASRSSDHNAWVDSDDPDTVGDVVTARDFTHDPAGGLDCHLLAAALVLSRDKRIKYVIWNKRIWTPGTGWKAYTGPNPHTKHLHLSVQATQKLYDSTTPWVLLGLTNEEDPLAGYTLDQIAKAVVDRVVVGNDVPLYRAVQLLVERQVGYGQRIEHIEAIVAGLQTGGVDEDKLADKVADRLAARLAD